MTSQMQEAFIDPKEMETLVCKIGTSILIQGHTIQASLVKMDADEHVQGLLHSIFMKAIHHHHMFLQQR